MKYLPSKADEKELRELIQTLREQIESIISKDTIKIVDVGSTAKGTWLPEESDIDMYIFTNEPKEDFDKVSKVFADGHRKQGQLLIWNFLLGKYDVDLIFAIPKHRKREDTTKHTAYFREHLTSKMCREVRKTKALFKTYGVYGADIGGIIGVAIEELIVQTGDLKNLCQITQSIDKPWIQDPTMTKPRNLLACIETKRWKQINELSKDYLAGKIKLRYDPMTLDRFGRNYPGYSTLYFRRKSDKHIDYLISSSILAKAERILKSKEREVTVESDIYLDDKLILFVFRVRPLELSETYEYCMDPVKGDAEAFKLAHPSTTEKVGLICATIRRGRTTYPETYFTFLIFSEMEHRGYCRW